MADDAGFVGLGFHPTGTAGSQPAASATGGGGATGDVGGVEPPSAADALLRSYMDQCLEYHRQHQHVAGQQQHPLYQSQQQQQQQQQASLPTFVSGPQIPASCVSAPPYPQQQQQLPSPASGTLPGSVGGQHHPTQHAAPEPHVPHPQPQHHHHHQQQQADDAQRQHERSIDDALAVAMRVVPSTGTPTGTGTDAPRRRPPLPQTISVPTRPPSDYAAKRAAHAVLFRKRLNSAYLRNLEYVARRDEADMERHREELERQRAHSRNLEVRHRQDFERRREQASAAAAAASGAGGGGEASSKLATSKSGIGTSSRKRIEHKKRKEGHHAGVAATDAERKRELRCAVYITGLPTDGTVTEEGLRGLFGSYGTVRRAVTYRDRRTGRAKGDGLVVYDRPGEGDAGAGSGKAVEELVGSVCAQLNGAELPCGSRICVEPADPDYDSKKEPTTNSTSNGQNGNTSTVATEDDVGYYGPAASTAANGSNAASSVHPQVETSKVPSPDDSTKNSVDADNGGTDDLDDFFASLT